MLNADPIFRSSNFTSVLLNTLSKHYSEETIPFLLNFFYRIKYSNIEISHKFLLIYF